MSKLHYQRTRFEVKIYIDENSFLWHREKVHQHSKPLAGRNSTKATKRKETHQRKTRRTIKVVPTFGNKTNSKCVWSSLALSQSKWIRVHRRKCIENAFVTKENLRIVFIYGAFCIGRTTQEENCFDLLFFVIRVCFGSSLSSELKKKLFIWLFCRVKRPPLPLFTKWTYSYKNANLHSRLISDSVSICSRSRHLLAPCESK